MSCKLKVVVSLLRRVDYQLDLGSYLKEKSQLVKFPMKVPTLTSTCSNEGLLNHYELLDFQTHGFPP